MKTNEKTTTTRQGTGQVAETVRQWIVSPEGQQAIDSGLRRAENMTTQFREAQRVDPDILRKPITL